MYEKMLLPADDPQKAFSRLYEIIKILRVECPWDRVQTHKSLRKCMLEEAYEVAEAIDNDDVTNLREELGDVMLQVVFHGTLGEDENEFTLQDIINEECEKMIRRHPHVFSNEEAKTVDNVLEKWENIKASESSLSCAQRLQKIPKALPALSRGEKVLNKAAQGGIEWEDKAKAFSKLQEEYDEVIASKDIDDPQAFEEEIGDLLFATVNVARFMGIDPEIALEKTIDKFINRADRFEKSLNSESGDVKDLSYEKKCQLWQQAKND